MRSYDGKTTRGTLMTKLGADATGAPFMRTGRDCSVVAGYVQCPTGGSCRPRRSHWRHCTAVAPTDPGIVPQKQLRARRVHPAPVARQRVAPLLQTLSAPVGRVSTRVPDAEPAAVNVAVSWTRVPRLDERLSAQPNASAAASRRSHYWEPVGVRVEDSEWWRAQRSAYLKDAPTICRWLAATRIVKSSDWLVCPR